VIAGGKAVYCTTKKTPCTLDSIPSPAKSNVQSSLEIGGIFWPTLPSAVGTLIFALNATSQGATGRSCYKIAQLNNLGA